MRMIDAEAKIVELAPHLDAALLGAKFKEYSRFGFPGASSTDGRGGEPPLPLMGTTDRSILRDRNEAEQYLTDAAVALERYTRIKNAWTHPYEGDPDEESRKELAGKMCANVPCMHLITGKKDDKSRNGRCNLCAEHFRRTGKERTAEMCDASHAREVALVPQEGSAV